MRWITVEDGMKIGDLVRLGRDGVSLEIMKPNGIYEYIILLFPSDV
jgi:hypothetical protein